MTGIISFFMSVIFVIDMFFVGFVPSKELVITKTAEQTEYCVAGVAE